MINCLSACNRVSSVMSGSPARERPRPVPVPVGWLLAAALLMAATGAPAHAQICPPIGPVLPSVPVPGQPGETGKLLKSKQDDKGNVLEAWCLDKRVDAAGNVIHGGPEFGLLFRHQLGPGLDAGRWVGACVFNGGLNKVNGSFQDTNRNGCPDEYKTVTFQNVEPPPAGTHDWEYTYDSATNKLKVDKTAGSWIIVVDPNTNKPTGVYKSKVIDTETYDAPSEFKDLKFKGSQLTSIDAPDSITSPAFAALATTSQPGTFTYALQDFNYGGVFTPSDPPTGFEADLQAGDLLTFTGTDINAPFVSGLALQPNYGAWVVNGFSSNFVSYRATSNAVFLPGDIVSGFGFSSTAGQGSIRWTLSSSNEAIGSFGTLDVPEPSPLLILLGGAAALGGTVLFRRRRRWNRLRPRPY